MKYTRGALVWRCERILETLHSRGGLCEKRSSARISTTATFVVAPNRVNIVAVNARLVLHVGKTGRWTVGWTPAKCTRGGAQTPLWFLVFGFWFLFFVFWLLAGVFWFLVFGVWLLACVPLAFGFWFLVYGSWLPGTGLWFLVFGFWLLVLGIWCLVHGSFLLAIGCCFWACGFWPRVFGFWFLVGSLKGTTPDTVLQGV